LEWGLKRGMHDPRLGRESKAVLQAMQRFALEQSAEESVNVNLESESTGRQTCPSCGNANRKGNNFCASCGAALLKTPEATEAARPASKPVTEAPGEHHYHHHYHHHYFSPADGVEPGTSPDSRMASGGAAAAREIPRVVRPLGGASLSRAETALRKLAQDWALACNTKQLDDLVDLYVPDAMVLRPNVPAVRGTAAIREFFFGLLDSGMSEVEMDPLRSELFGDFGYETGRCKSLVPVAMGKRREERGKYLVILNRQANGEWKIMADSWSSDLSLGAAAEPLVKPSVPPGNLIPRPPRKP
jgi:ketosteroid isomerase-like protein